MVKEEAEERREGREKREGREGRRERNGGGERGRKCSSLSKLVAMHEVG